MIGAAFIVSGRVVVDHEHVRERLPPVMRILVAPQDAHGKLDTVQMGTGETDVSRNNEITDPRRTSAGVHRDGKPTSASGCRGLTADATAATHVGSWIHRRTSLDHHHTTKSPPSDLL